MNVFYETVHQGVFILCVCVCVFLLLLYSPVSRPLDRSIEQEYDVVAG